MLLNPVSTKTGEDQRNASGVMGQGGVVAKQTRVVQWGGVGVNLRPHAYQAAAERLLAPMGANFRHFRAFGAHGAPTSADGRWDCLCDCSLGLNTSERSHDRGKGLESQQNDHVGKRYYAVVRVFVPYVTV